MGENHYHVLHCSTVCNPCGSTRYLQYTSLTARRRSDGGVSSHKFCRTRQVVMCKQRDGPCVVTADTTQCVAHRRYFVLDSPRGYLKYMPCMMNEVSVKAYARQSLSVSPARYACLVLQIPPIVYMKWINFTYNNAYSI